LFMLFDLGFSSFLDMGLWVPGLFRSNLGMWCSCCIENRFGLGEVRWGEGERMEKKRPWGRWWEDEEEARKKMKKPGN
jgi:hypothetical protein